MSMSVKLQSEDAKFLIDAYLIDPKLERGNLSSVAVWGGDGTDHPSELIGQIMKRLFNAGYAVFSHSAVWNIGNPPGDKEVIIFGLTPIGQSKAQDLLEKRIYRSFCEKFHRINSATWGGLAAIVAAVASISGAVFSYMALKS